MGNKGLFKSAKIVHKTLEWATGTDICPDDLYELSKPLRNEYNDISMYCKESNEPDYLTKNGEEDLQDIRQGNTSIKSTSW